MSTLSNCVLEHPFEFELDSYWSLMRHNDLYDYLDLFHPLGTSLTCMDLEDGTFPLAANVKCVQGSCATIPVQQPTGIKRKGPKKEVLPVYSEYEGRFLRGSSQDSDSDAEDLCVRFPDLFPPPKKSDHSYCYFQTPSYSDEDIDVVSCDPPSTTPRPTPTPPTPPPQTRLEIQILPTAWPSLPEADGSPSDSLPPDSPPVEFSPVEPFTGPPAGYPPADRRNHHNILERMRRSELRDQFEKLRRLVPELVQAPKAPKQTILNQASAWIHKLEKDEKLLLLKKDFYQKQVEKTLEALGQLS